MSNWLLALVPLLTIGCVTAATAPDASVRTPTQWAPGNYVINLYDAFGPPREGLTHDFGFSAVVRYEGKTILFDGGTNADLLRANTEALGIDLRDVDFAVASHAHFDHISGFDHLLEVNPDVPIYFPADPFWGGPMEFSVAGPEPDARDALPDDQRYFGGHKEAFEMNQSGRFWMAYVKYVAEHEEIAPGITLIANRSPFMGYFTRYPSLGGVEVKDAGGGVKTMELPELSLNLATPEGDVLLVGCSHSLVETIVRTTKEHLGRDIGLVYGGYHLLPYTSEQVTEMATRMKDELGVARVAPAHCTGHVGFKVFREVFADAYVLAGLGTKTDFPASSG